VTATFDVVQTPPTVSITGQSIDARNATASFTFTASGGTPTCQLDGGAAPSCSGSASYNNLAPGRHTFVVAVASSAGTASDSRSFFTDAWADAVNGLDTNLGNVNAPFQRITTALGVSVAGMTTWVTPGSYTTAIGEIFPISIPNGVSLIGDEA